MYVCRCYYLNRLLTQSRYTQINYFYDAGYSRGKQSFTITAPWDHTSSQDATLWHNLALIKHVCDRF